MTESGAPHPFLAALIENWPAVLAELDDDQRTALAGLLLGADPPVRRLAAVRRLLMSALPPDGPAARALFADVSVKYAPSAVESPVLIRQLAELGDLAGRIPVQRSGTDPLVPGTDPLVPGGGSPGLRGAGQVSGTGEPWRDLHAQVRERLSHLEWRRPDRRRPLAAPGTEDVIVLRYARDDVRLPEFQFDPEGRVLAVVTRVNRLLGASRDPWAVACWWVGRHRWFQAAPVDLIGERDDDLVDAARAVREGNGPDGGF